MSVQVTRAGAGVRAVCRDCGWKGPIRHATQHVATSEAARHVCPPREDVNPLHTGAAHHSCRGRDRKPPELSAKKVRAGIWLVRCSACGDDWEFDYDGNDQDGNDTRLNPGRNMDEGLRTAERALRGSATLDTVRAYVRAAERSGVPQLVAYDRALALAPGEIRLVNEAAFTDQSEEARRRWHGRLMLLREDPSLGTDDQAGRRYMSLWSPESRTYFELLPAGDVFTWAADRLDNVGYVRAIVRDEDGELWEPEYLTRELTDADEAQIAAAAGAIELTGADAADGDPVGLPQEQWSGWLMTRLADAIWAFINGSGPDRTPTEIIFSRLAVGDGADTGAVEEIEEEAGGFEDSRTVLGAFDEVMSDSECAGDDFVAERTVFSRLRGLATPGGAPSWREVGRLGDVNLVEYGGAIVYEDANGAHAPEMEWVEVDGRRLIAFRITLEPHTYRGGILSNNSFHPNMPAWYADRIEQVADSTDQDPQDLIRALRGRDVMAKANAYRDLIGFFGANEFDQYPLRLSRKEARERYETSD